jgi:hypothetical protein
MIPSLCNLPLIENAFLFAVERPVLPLIPPENSKPNLISDSPSYYGKKPAA